MGSKKEEGLIRVNFHYAHHPWAPTDVESVLAKAIGENLYQLRNVPFFAFGVALDDIVATEDTATGISFRHVVAHSGHSNYRAFLNDHVTPDSASCADLLAEAKVLGVTYEGAWDKLISFDVPPCSNVADFYEILKKGQKLGIWDFEEAYFGGTKRS